MENRFVTARLNLLFILPFAFSACQTMQQDTDKQSDAVTHRLHQLMQPQPQTTLTDQNVTAAHVISTANASVIQRVPGAWLGGHAVPIQADATLPEIFRRPDFRFQFGKGNMMTIAEKLTEVTHIPVRVQPDVLMPISALMIKHGATSTSISNAEPAGVSAPQSLEPRLFPPLPPLPNTVNVNATSAISPFSQDKRGGAIYSMNYLGTLSGYLELLCAQAGISWDYHNGVITLRRLVTKTFTLKAIPGASGFDAALGRDAQMHTGIQSSSQRGSSIGMGGYASTTKVKMGSTYSVWTSLKKMIDATKSPIGRYSISEATGTITVTDTRTAVEDIARIIEHENSLLTRQIAMRVEVLSVKLLRGQDYGIDWNLIFQKVTRGVPWSLRFSSPPSALLSNASNMGISILSPATGAAGAWSGSRALFNALAQYGRVSVVTTANALTVNRQPVPVAITQQTGYLAEITPAPAGTSGNVGGTPGLTPGIVTTGFMLNLLPTVLDSNHILLQFSVGISSLNALDKQTSGEGNHQQSIQTPVISSTDFLQKVAMRPGETLVLSGYERQSGQYDKRMLHPRLPVGVGGSFSGNNDREAVVILVTPVVTESAV